MLPSNKLMYAYLCAVCSRYVAASAATRPASAAWTASAVAATKPCQETSLQYVACSLSINKACSHNMSRSLLRGLGYVRLWNRCFCTVL